MSNESVSDIGVSLNIPSQNSCILTVSHITRFCRMADRSPSMEKKPFPATFDGPCQRGASTGRLCLTVSRVGDKHGKRC